MKRSILLTLVAVLALTIGLNGTASAGGGADAQAAAKKGKSKGCKRKGKGKSKASAAASAKKKAKGKGCKKHGKAKGKGKPKGAGNDVATPTPPANALLGDGIYGDAANLLELNVSNGATTVVLKYVPPGFCAGVNYTSEPVSLTKNGDTWTANETRSFSIIGTPAHVKWDLTVKEGLGYALNLTLESEPDVIGPCKGEGHPTGTLTKVG